MMPLPWVAGSPLAWRLDLQPHGSTWDSGIGSANVGGRWNPVGYPVVYWLHGGRPGEETKGISLAPHINVAMKKGQVPPDLRYFEQTQK